jgi:hypothetical protein
VGAGVGALGDFFVACGWPHLPGAHTFIPTAFLLDTLVLIIRVCLVFCSPTISATIRLFGSDFAFDFCLEFSLLNTAPCILV